MTKPVRLQLSRRRGFSLQAASRAANGLPAVNVARPTRWGNPYRPAENFPAQECVDAYRDMWKDMLIGRPEHARRELTRLCGKNLACWCRPGAPCHADVLLELANAVCEALEPVTRSGGNRSSESISGDKGPRATPIEGSR